MSIAEANKFDTSQQKSFLILKFLFVFALMYDINFAFMPSLTTGRIAFLSLLLISFNRIWTFSKETIYFVLVIIFVFCISFIQNFLSSDFTQTSRLLWFTIYGIITPFLFFSYLTNRNEFLLLLSAAVGFQSLLSILSFINPGIKAIFYNLIVFTSNFDEIQTIRAVGFASIGGAGLSVIQSIGVISTLMFLRFNNVGFLRTILLWCVIFLIIISTLIIGRTGLFISIFSLFIYFISSKIRLHNVILSGVVVLIALQINFINIFERLTSNVEGFDIELFTGWIENAFKLKDNATTEDLGSMPVPPLSLNTIIGTGRVVHESGVGNASGHDSGYIQTYYSLGLLTAIFFYISYFAFLVGKAWNKKSKVLLILIMIQFIIEVKEPFIFQYVFPFFVLSTILITNKGVLGKDMIMQKIQPV